MEQKKTIPMTPFDSLISSEQLQMMKLMLPYMPPGTQKFFAFYIKFLELRLPLLICFVIFSLI